MAIKPLQMPNLSALPDPTRDMFGGMTDPTALMRMDDKQVNDLLNPKPLFEQNVKLSSQAQQTLNNIAQQQQALATETDRMAEQVRRQQQEAYEAQLKASQQQVKENERRVKELLKAQEGRKKKAEEQGGKLGASADGSFILQTKAQQLLKSPEWQRIVSNLQRDDEMEMWLKLAEAKLREAGVTDEAVIKAELDVARNIISNDTKSYTQKMKEDNIDPLDVVTSLGKAARTIYRGAGILFGASEGWAKDEKDAIDSIGRTYSNTLLLDQANYAYQRSKTKAKNPDEGIVDGFVSGAKDAWDSGNVISGIVDSAGYIPYAVLGTTTLAKGIATAGATTGLTGVTTALTGKTAAVSSIGGRLVGGILSAETGGAAITSGLLSATDAASGAYDSVMALDFNDKAQLAKARKLYSDAYGEANWNNLVKEHGGDMNKVKAELATQAGRLAGGTAFVTTAPLGVFGLEATLAKMGTHGVAAQAGKRLMTVGANTVSETLEEGFTQLSQNYGARPVTGVSLTDDVGATAAMGAIAGGGMSAGSQAIAFAMDTHTTQTKPSFNASELDANRWVSAGNVNYDAYRNVVGHQMDNIARDGRRTKLSEDDIQQLQQRAFNDYVDNNEVWSRLTPEQQAEFKEYLRLSYNINSNGYARYQETAEAKAWVSNDYTQINNAIVDNPQSTDLLNAYRVKNNVELEQVPQSGREYFKALADVLDAMATQDTNVTTQEREIQSMRIIADKVKGNDKLTDLQKRGITMFMMNSMDAGSRRMTDEQQADYDRVQYAAKQVQANQQRVNQNDAQEQNQTSASQLSGQGTTEEDVRAEPPQGSTDGAGTSDTLSTIAAELATTEPAGQGSNHAEGIGNDPVGQAPITSDPTDDPTPSSTSAGADDKGLGQTPTARDTQFTSTPTNDSRPITQQGVAGQTNQDGQSLGQIRPSTTQATTSGGGVGVTPTERRTDDPSPQVITQADVNDSFIADPANEVYVKSFINVAYNDLGKFGQGITKHKADLRRLAGISGVEGGKLSEEHIDKLYDLINLPMSVRTTLINNEFRTQAATNRVHNAVHHLKQNTIKAIKADIKAQKQARRSAERNAEQQVAQQALQQEREQVETNGQQTSDTKPDPTSVPEEATEVVEINEVTDEETTEAVETSEVTTDGTTFNLQEIISGVTNKRIRKGEVPPTLNDLAPEDDTADRPTIELTINGKTHTGKLYRFRKGNRRFIAFVHDGNAYGMKAVQNGVENQDWINFGAGVGTKRVDSINTQTAIHIRVLDGTYSQQDLFNQQETVNETKQTGRVADSDQPTDTRTQDEDTPNAVGDNPRANVGQREVSSESGRGDGTGSQTSGNETTDGPVGDTQTENDGNQTQSVSVDVDNAPSGNSLVDAYFEQNPKDKTKLEKYLTNTRQRLEQVISTEQSSELVAQFQQELDALPANAVEMVNAYLTDGVALKDAVKQAVRSTRPVANGFTLDNLPQEIKDVLNKIWDSLKNTIAVVSMALTLTTGSTLVVPNEAMASTPVEQATVQHIVRTDDNEGKPFIVANKQAGTLTVYTATGQELTSTPALFGKNVGDSITAKNTTPSGRYGMTRVEGANIKGNERGQYGNSAQALTVDGQLQTNNAGNLAIHRVLPIENRQGRLDSATTTDNRISHGCINVPASFYDAYIDNAGDAVVYVLPETNAGRTGVFSGVGTSDLSRSETRINTPTTATTVAPEMDNANAKSVEVKPSDIQSAPTTYSDPKQAPVKALIPLTIAGTQPSGQVAYVAPLVVGGITADQINVPFKVHTAAELQANGVYDTEPVTNSLRSDGGTGFNIYEIAAWLAGIGATTKIISKRRKKKLASKKESDQPTTDNANEETVTSEQNPSGADRNEQAQASVDDNHNDKVNHSANHVIKNASAQPQKDLLTDAVTRAMWLDYLANSHLTIAKGEDGNMVEGGDIYSAFVDSMLGFEWAIDDVMQDHTIEQANDGTFADPLKWRNEISEKGRAGVSAKLMNWAAGVTQAFDNLMTEHGIARVGYEMDSSIPSKHLAQIKAKASGAYAQIHKLYVKPLALKVDILAGNLRTSYTKLEHDIGRVATVKHVLNEAADAMWRGREHIIRTHQEQLAAVNQAIANTAEGNEVRLTLTTKARLLQKEIQEQTELLNKARDMYNGVIPWDGKTGMPGGYTKAQAEKVLADLKAKYGSDFSQVEQLATETVQTIRGIRNFAAAAGVFSNADLQTFHDLGFTEYVPLYAEQKDPLEVDETNAYTKQSIMDELTADLPAREARAMGLTKDLSRYHREGAIEPAADAFTNMKVFSMNMAGRVGQQGWLNSVQQLYEGTVGKPISATHITDEETLKALNASPDSGKLPGLIRVRPGMEQFAGVDTKKFKPIVAKGHNSYGEVVTYHYYFTEPAIQAEIYSNSDLTETLTAKGLRNVGTLTRLAARMMTTFKPVWNIYNWARDSLERISVMLMRPVKDKDGNLVNKWDLSKAYFGHLASMASSPSAQTEIYRYLVLGETKTKLQKILHEAVGEGAINLMTSQNEKHSIMADLNKSTIDKLSSQATAMLGEGFNKAGAGKIKRGADQLVDMYVMRLTEVPQITTALSAYMAYQDVGVNKGETANRVRDQYDPIRANNQVINSMTQVYPFIRSTLSGHYNLWRTLSEYWRPNTWQAPLAYMVVGTLGTMAVLTMMSAMFGDDEDGVPKVARLPIGTLMNGIPVPIGDGGVWSLPVGFGMNKLAWGIGANLWRQSMGMQTSGETLKSLLGLVVDNTSPSQVASGNIMNENPAVGMALTFTPLLAKPMMEIATNTKSFGGAKIINRETPKDQYDSDQDSFNTPETYKTWAKALRETTGIDMRPETMRHLIESYSWGPLGAVPKSIIQDQSEKTLGNRERKGEVFGPLMTAIGADIAIQPNALDYAQHTFVMQNLRMELHKKYGVGASHSDEVYEQYADRGKRGGIIEQADVVTERAMRAKGVPEHIIKYVVNGMRYDANRKKANTDFEKLADAYYELRQQGKDDPVMRMAVQSAWDNLENLTYKYVKENNRAYFEIMQQQ